jgi:hypothetical protein
LCKTPYKTPNNVNNDVKLTENNKITKIFITKINLWIENQQLLNKYCNIINKYQLLLIFIDDKKQGGYSMIIHRISAYYYFKILLG